MHCSNRIAVYTLMVTRALLIALFLSLCAVLLAESSTSRGAVLVNFETSIDGGAVAYIERVSAQYSGKVLILRINSYGGYLSAADKIVNTILEKGVECYAWIPQGGYAVSAATLIALACSGIYMGEGAVIGGVSPIPAEPKVVEYVKARVTSLLERLGVENATGIAEELVVHAKTYTREEATRLGLAKRADTLDEVLSALNLHLEISEEPSLWEKLLSVISNPVISEIMLFAGVILILAEIFTTGFQGYGVAGAVMIILSLYSMAIIPVEIVHLALVLSGAVLLAIEIFTPGFGVFGVAGIVLTATGLILTLTTTPPQVLTPLVYVVVAGVAGLTGFFLYIAYSAVKATRIKRKSLEEILVGAIGYAKTEIKETEPGVVYVAGEDWTAYSTKGTIPQGCRIRVVRVEGLKLYVERAE